MTLRAPTVLLSCCTGLLLAACMGATQTFPTDTPAADAVALDAPPDAAPSPDAAPEAALEAAAPDARPDAGPEAAVMLPPETGRTLTYVLSSMTIDDTAASTYAGFNHDGLFSTDTTPRSCDHADQASSLDRDQNCPTAMLGADGRCSSSAGCAAGAGCQGGVDNQLPTIADAVVTVVGMDLRSEIQRRISASELVFVLRVTNVDDLVEDPSVELKVYQAWPTFTTGCTGVLPDRQYVVQQGSLLPGATSLSMARFAVPGSIRGGRLYPSTGGVLTLPVAVGVNIDVRGSLLRANVTDTALSAGNLGGYSSGSAFYDAVVGMNPSLAAVAGVFVGGSVDLEDPLPTPGSAMGLCSNTGARPPRFGNVGIGARFTAVRATLLDTPASAAPVGACGN